ncbi:hypothetical protein C0995_006109, partial [Termitomyces sp. Mi166
MAGLMQNISVIIAEYDPCLNHSVQVLQLYSVNMSVLTGGDKDNHYDNEVLKDDKGVKDMQDGMASINNCPATLNSVFDVHSIKATKFSVAAH